MKRRIVLVCLTVAALAPAAGGALAVSFDVGCRIRARRLRREQEKHRQELAAYLMPRLDDIARGLNVVAAEIGRQS